jgi:hypothetical protein
LPPPEANALSSAQVMGIHDCHVPDIDDATVLQ